MKTTDQGTRPSGRERYLTVPRTLIFLTSTNPDTGAPQLLLLRGAANKRLWAGLYNGLGGHVEAGEDVYQAAQREVDEETGLMVEGLRLCGVINIDTGHDEQGQRSGVLIFVFLGHTEVRSVHATAEGTPEWIDIGALEHLPMVDDLYELLPRILNADFVYAHYQPDPGGELHYYFRTGVGPASTVR